MRVRFFTFLVLFAFAFAQSSLFAQGTQGTQGAQGTCTPPCPNPCTPPCPTPVIGGGTTQWEISPYAGYIWSDNNGEVGSFFNTQILGVRGGGYVTTGFEIGLNWANNRHFQPSRGNSIAAFGGDLGFAQPAMRSNLFELEFTYNFGGRGVFGQNVKPYVVAGAGLIRSSLQNQNGRDFFVLNTRSIDVPGVLPAALQAAQAGGTLQSFVPGANLGDGVAILSNPSGTGSTVVVANDVMQNHADFFTFSYGGGLKLARLWGPLGFFGDIRGRTIPNLFDGHVTNLLEVSAGLNFAWGER
jgi:hypothetical protein